MAKKYEETAKVLLPAVGGKANITTFQHCVTRLRFNVKDKSLVDLKAIEAAPGVKGVQWANEELQVIIGANVAEAYDAVAEYGGLAKEASLDINLDGNLGEKKKLTIGSIFGNLLSTVAACVSPLLPMMIAGGMIKVLYVALNMLGILASDSSTYQIMSWIGDTWIYFYPIFVASTAAKRFGGNQGLAMLLGGTLVYPGFLTAIGAGTPLTFLGLPVYATNYAYTVIPAIMVAFVASKVEKFIAKHSPDALKALLVPWLTALIMLPVALVVVAPLGYYIGTFIVGFVKWVQNTMGWVAVSLYCTITPLLVITSMHRLMSPYWSGALASTGQEGLCMPTGIVSNVNLSAVAFAVALKAKAKKIKSEAFSAGVTASVAGISEPTLFGFVTRSKKLLYAVMIGNFAGGTILGLNNVVVYAFPGTTGIFGPIAAIGENPANLTWMLIAVAVGFVVTFACTYFFGVEEDKILKAENN